MRNYKELLYSITTLIFDYDGVMTDGSVLMNENGEALRRTNAKDGYALNLAVKLGYRIVIISGGQGEGVKKRLECLNINEFFLGVSDKQRVLEKFLNDNNIKPEACLYMGDDLPDYIPMQYVGLACCPADAAIEIKNISHYISYKNGGEGCVRDIVEQVLKVQGKWMQNHDAHLW